MVQCSEKVDCQWSERVVEDVDDGCAKLLGLAGAQECINAADEQEVVQYIESAACR